MKQVLSESTSGMMVSTIVIGLLALAGTSRGFTGRGVMYPGRSDLFELPIIHINDFHARYEEVGPRAGTCHRDEGEECVGGLPRVLTGIKQLFEERGPNSIFLNAGDHYQGTLWYNVHKWNATATFLNMLPHDVMTIGNHEFDDGIDGLVPFLKNVVSPVVVTNIDYTHEPRMQGLMTNSTIITRAGRKIGVIGVIFKGTASIASTEKLIFLDEVETVNLEAEKLKREDDVDIIIVLSHAGIDVDRIMAANCPLIDVIVGGHSHTFLFTGDKPPFVDIPEDVYPVVVTQNNPLRTVLIVQAAAFTKYLGNLTVWFNEAGEVEDWDGNPILLDDGIPEDPEMLRALAPWKIAVDGLSKKVIGESRVELRHGCRDGECNLGNLITDAMVDGFVEKAENKSYWTYASIAVMNGGAVRAGISSASGVITYGDVVVTQPFENMWDVAEMLGKDIRETLEVSVAIGYNSTKFPNRAYVFWSGLRVTYNLTAELYSRVVDVKVRCRRCQVPEFEALRDNEWYRIVIPSFLLSGGDSHTIIQKRHRNRVRGMRDLDQLTKYITKNSPLFSGTERRVIFLEG
ncbi:apyrase isoform X2 [Diachasmimorpha longicaudata]|uniref:apyrase isoform X2 n=1 Tax=Diachasmimorpha longicaudata TaxID=58733 RepID=UPI0030B8D75D